MVSTSKSERLLRTRIVESLRRETATKERRFTAWPSVSPSSISVWSPITLTRPGTDQMPSGAASKRAANSSATNPVVMRVMVLLETADRRSANYGLSKCYAGLSNDARLFGLCAAITARNSGHADANPGCRGSEVTASSATHSNADDSVSPATGSKDSSVTTT